MKLIDFLKIVFCLPVLPILGAGGGAAGGSAGSEGDGDGDGDEGNEGGTGSEGSEGGDGGNKGGKTFTQEEVNRMMAREKKQGSKAILKELGVDKAEDLKSIIAEYREKHKNEEGAVAEEVSKVNAAKDEADRRATMAEAKVQAMMLGAKPEDVEDVIALAMAKLDDDADDFKEIISEIKSKHPQMFVGNSEEDNKPGKKGTGTPPGNKGGKKDEEESIGARLAGLRKSNGSAKSAYFKNK